MYVVLLTLRIFSPVPPFPRRILYRVRLQLLAALAYSKNTPGVWFLNPQAWVKEHLFKAASIWDVPLVKPRFVCSVRRSILNAGKDAEIADVLSRNLELFRKGGSCENGLIAADPELGPLEEAHV